MQFKQFSTQNCPPSQGPVFEAPATRPAACAEAQVSLLQACAPAASTPTEL